MHSAATSQALRKDIVLVGGGHAHALVLLQWCMQPIHEARVTLISEQSRSPYSGMLPGVIAGHYADDDIHIDLRRLCLQAGARFIQARVIGVDPQAKRVLLDGRPPIEYDILSINTGITPDISVDGAVRHAVPVKPIAGFLSRWRVVLAQLEQSSKPLTVAVVGGGAGSVELILAMAYRLQTAKVVHHWVLITRSTTLLPDYPERMRTYLQCRLARYCIQVFTATDAVEVNATGVIASNGQRIPADHVFWCTQARPPAWLAESGLANSNWADEKLFAEQKMLSASKIVENQCSDNALARREQGFLMVNSALQSERFPEVFGAGDCAWISNCVLPRAGVYAVRQAPILASNLVRYLRQQSLLHYHPQHNFLSLLACGGADAVGAKGRVSMAGAWVWRWKDRIDRRFMRMFQRLPVLPPLVVDSDNVIPANERCGGCGGKVSGDILRSALSILDAARDGNVENCLLVPAEDAAVITIPNAVTPRLVQSVDAIKPLFDDPWLFARVATLHALSDLYAMHTKPHSAQLLLQLPVMHERLLQRDLTQILLGADAVLHEQGATLVGGHSVEAESLQIGLAVNAFAPVTAILKKRGAQTGDALILTKPLGVGVLFAAAMRGYLQSVWIDQAIASMGESNASAAEIFGLLGAHALTDITGFGLAGHLQEMLGDKGAQIDLSTIPLLPGADLCFQQGYQSTLAPANRRQVQTWLLADELALMDARYNVLFDPQTNGGLLAAVSAGQRDECLQALWSRGITAVLIGTCTSSGPLRITLNIP